MINDIIIILTFTGFVFAIGYVSWRINSKYIFTTSFNEKISTHRLTKVLNKVQEKEDFHYRVHDFRHTFCSNLIVDEKVIVETKVVTAFNDNHFAQILGYLAITDLRVGLLLNFKHACPPIELRWLPIFNR